MINYIILSFKSINSISFLYLININLFKSERLNLNTMEPNLSNENILDLEKTKTDLTRTNSQKNNVHNILSATR